jgi:hypothetical protein
MPTAFRFDTVRAMSVATLNRTTAEVEVAAGCGT